MTAPAATPWLRLTCPHCERPFRVRGRKRDHAEGDGKTPAAPPQAARAGEVALAGPDGARAAELLRESKRQGVGVMAELCERAASRLLAAGRKPRLRDPLFTDSERDMLAEQYAATGSSAELLGRGRIRQRLGVIKSGRRLFAEDATPWLHLFAEGDAVEPMAPEAALDYWRSLVPEVGGGDVVSFAERQRRRGLTLAVATEERLVRRFQRLITDYLRGTPEGRTLPGEEAVRRLLDDAGVSIRNPQYPEMCFRTAMHEAYSEGTQRERMDPEVQSVFPVFRYLGVADGREGDDHRPKFGKYYPSSVAFTDVRGPRIWNCRCAEAAVEATEWDELRARGARLAPGYSLALGA